MKKAKPATEIFDSGRATSFTASDADKKALQDLIAMDASYANIGVTALFRMGLQALRSQELQQRALSATK